MYQLDEESTDELIVQSARENSEQFLKLRANEKP